MVDNLHPSISCRDSNVTLPADSKFYMTDMFAQTKMKTPNHEPKV